MGELRDLGDQDEGPPAAPCVVHPHLLWGFGVLLTKDGTPSGEMPADAPQALYLHEPGSFRPMAIARRERTDVPAMLHHYQLDRLGKPQELVNDNGIVT